MNIADYYKGRIADLEKEASELRAGEIKLTEIIYALLDPNPPNEYKKAIRRSIFNN